MPNYRNSNIDPRNDPLRRGRAAGPDARAMNAIWGWLAAAALIAVVLAVAFGDYIPGPPGAAPHSAMPSALTRMAPPANRAPPAPLTPPPNSAR
jgi:hypothetical protein